jgi:hypothetical protein
MAISTLHKEVLGNLNHKQVEKTTKSILIIYLNFIQSFELR